MQYEVDSYILEYDENNDKYYISFIDSVKQTCRMEITKDIFDAYINSRKSYIKVGNEFSRHIEHLNLNENELYKKSFKKEDTVEEIVLKNIDNEKLKMH